MRPMQNVRAFLLALTLGAAALEAADIAGLPAIRPEEAGLSGEGLRGLRALLEENVAKKSVAGAVGLVARKGKVAWLEAVGSAEIDAGRPMTPETIFRICSMTKPITSVAAMILAEEGKLSLDDPVSKFIPEFTDSRVFVKTPPANGGAEGFELAPAKRGITVRDLLTHTSGLTYGFLGHPHLSELHKKAGITEGLIETDLTLAENARRIASLPLVHQPGTAWEYGLSTDVLGRVVEVASGMSLDAFFKKRIFDPLGMKDSHFRIPAEKRPRLAAAYRPGKEGIEELPDGPVGSEAFRYSASYPYAGPGTYHSGGAGLVSTVPDYARFLLMLRNKGELGGARILKKETVEDMTRSHTDGVPIVIQNHGDKFGLGFGVVTPAAKDRGLGSEGTFSWGGFYYTYFWVDPEKDVVAIVMAQLHPWDGRTLWDDFRKRVYAAVMD